MNELKEITGDKDFDELLFKCINILKTKSEDYAEKSDRLAEIRSTAITTGVSMRTVLGIYLNKHLRSLYKWIKGEELKGEPVSEKLSDIIVYSLLIYKLSKNEKRIKDIDRNINDEVLHRLVHSHQNKNKFY